MTESINSKYTYKWRYADLERPRGVCYDCKLQYNKFEDYTIPDCDWERINPTYRRGAGLLCPTCIVNRLHFIKLWYRESPSNLDFKEICKKFGGQRATARVLGKDSSNIRRVCRGAMKLPPTWMPVLKEEAAKIAKEMADFSENGTCT